MLPTPLKTPAQCRRPPCPGKAGVQVPVRRGWGVRGAEACPHTAVSCRGKACIEHPAPPLPPSPPLLPRRSSCRPSLAQWLLLPPTQVPPRIAPQNGQPEKRWARGKQSKQAKMKKMGAGLEHSHAAPDCRQQPMHGRKEGPCSEGLCRDWRCVCTPTAGVGGVAQRKGREVMGWNMYAIDIHVY